MNSIDIVCSVIILFFTLLGIWHGFLRGIFRLIAWAAAIAGAYFANDTLSASISSALQTSSFSTTLICICIGFIIPFLGFLFISHMVNKAITGTVAGKADRILGAIFGVVKAILICFVLLTVLHILPFGGVVEETRNDSVAYAAYKGSLESMGYSSEPVDLVGVAERKASEFTKNMANKATEKATEAANEAANKAREKAAEIATEAPEKANAMAAEAAREIVQEVSDKAAEAAKEAAKEAAEEAAKKAVNKISTKAIPTAKE
jgi:membrane protein required for colicin V production